jgi:hypothetical protein
LHWNAGTALPSFFWGLSVAQQEPQFSPNAITTATDKLAGADLPQPYSRAFLHLQPATHEEKQRYDRGHVDAKE